MLAGDHKSIMWSDCGEKLHIHNFQSESKQVSKEASEFMILTEYHTSGSTTYWQHKGGSPPKFAETLLPSVPIALQFPLGTLKL